MKGVDFNTHSLYVYKTGKKLSTTYHFLLKGNAHSNTVEITGYCSNKQLKEKVGAKLPPEIYNPILAEQLGELIASYFPLIDLQKNEIYNFAPVMPETTTKTPPFVGKSIPHEPLSQKELEILVSEIQMPKK